MTTIQGKASGDLVWLGAIGLTAIVPAWNSAAEQAGLPLVFPTPAEMVLLITVGVASWTDLTRRIIPNRLTFAALAAGAVINLMAALGPASLSETLGAVGPGDFALGVALGFIPFALLHQFRAVGGGDVKLVAAICGLLGPWAGLDALISGLGMAAVAAGFVLSSRIASGSLGTIVERPASPDLSGASPTRRSRGLPLAPFLAAGAVVYLLFHGGRHVPTP